MILDVLLAHRCLECPNIRKYKYRRSRSSIGAYYFERPKLYECPYPSSHSASDSNPFSFLAHLESPSQHSKHAIWLPFLVPTPSIQTRTFQILQARYVIPVSYQSMDNETHTLADIHRHRWISRHWLRYRRTPPPTQCQQCHNPIKQRRTRQIRPRRTQRIRRHQQSPLDKMRSRRPQIHRQSCQ